MVFDIDAGDEKSRYLKTKLLLYLKKAQLDLINYI